MKLKKNHLFFHVNNINQAMETISICKKTKIVPILCFKFYLINRFGIDWIDQFRNLILKKYPKKDFAMLINCRKNYGLFIKLIEKKMQFLQVNASPGTLSRLKNIAKKNNVTVNPKISIIDLTNIKNIRLKIKKI